jgi:Histidinol dehydrogenase
MRLSLNAAWPCCVSDPAQEVTLSWTWTALLQELPEPQLDAESVAAFDTAFNNIRAFHDAQQAAPLEVETMPGVRCRRVTRPIGTQYSYNISSPISVVQGQQNTWSCSTRCRAAAQLQTTTLAWCTPLLLRLLAIFPATRAGAVGIYVPGGTAVLPSSALMLSVPAGLAGCKTIVLATPPRQDGSISPEVQCSGLMCPTSLHMTQKHFCSPENLVC